MDEHAQAGVGADDQLYWERRAMRQEELARAAASLSAMTAHETLAAEYRARARQRCRAKD